MIEINYFSQVGLVCSEGFTDNDARVVCKVNNFSYGKAFKASGKGKVLFARSIQSLGQRYTIVCKVNNFSYGKALKASGKGKVLFARATTSLTEKHLKPRAKVKYCFTKLTTSPTRKRSKPRAKLKYCLQGQQLLPCESIQRHGQRSNIVCKVPRENIQNLWQRKSIVCKVNNFSHGKAFKASGKGVGIVCKVNNSHGKALKTSGKGKILFARSTTSPTGKRSKPPVKVKYCLQGQQFLPREERFSINFLPIAQISLC